MAIHIYSGSIRTKRATIRYHFRHLRLILAVFGSFLLNVILVACKHLQTAKTLLPHHFQLVTSIYSHSLQVSGLIEFGLSWCWTFWLFWLIFGQSQPSTLKIPKKVLLHHFQICLTIYSHSGIIRTKRVREVLYFGNLGTDFGYIWIIFNQFPLRWPLNTLKLKLLQNHNVLPFSMTYNYHA